MSTEIFEIVPGDGPVVLAQPHGGTWLPEDLRARLNARGQGLDDTDWHIARLYEGLLPSATVVRMNVHRYAIDANRDPGGASLYPGQNTTELCPTTDFDGNPIWQDGQAPSKDEIAARTDRYHRPYHAALADALDAVRAAHGVAVLYDCHSIRSEIPYLFEGRLPVFNIGTNEGVTCAEVLAAETETLCAASPHDSVRDGRFKGGWTTRHYGRPGEGLHAIQMEIAQRAYMEEAAPWEYRPDRADLLRPHLGAILARLDILARSGDLIQQDGDAT